MSRRELGRRVWRFVGTSLAASALTLTPAAPASADDPTVSSATEAQARAIEIQLIAPCCKTQTLDVHESPVVTSMKKEIRARLAAGDAPESILRGFEERYGPDVRAVRSGEAASSLGAVLAALGAVGAAGAAYLLRRWLRESQRTAVVPPSGHDTRDRWDEALDDELAALDR